MPTEITSTRASSGVVATVVTLLVGGVSESVLTAQGQPWWYVPAAMAVGVVIWWAVYALIVVMEARAKMDGVEDWADIAYRRLRQAWTRQKISQVQPEPDEGEETKE